MNEMSGGCGTKREGPLISFSRDDFHSDVRHDPTVINYDEKSPVTRKPSLFVLITYMNQSSTVYTTWS